MVVVPVDLCSSTPGSFIALLTVSLTSPSWNELNELISRLSLLLCCGVHAQTSDESEKPCALRDVAERIYFCMDRFPMRNVTNA